MIIPSIQADEIFSIGPPAVRIRNPDPPGIEQISIDRSPLHRGNLAIVLSNEQRPSQHCHERPRILKFPVARVKVNPTQSQNDKMAKRRNDCGLDKMIGSLEQRGTGGCCKGTSFIVSRFRFPRGLKGNRSDLQ
jgi:hypothetical protein